MIFEEWIHNRIRDTFNIDTEFRQFTGKKDLEEVTRQDIENFQFFRLRKTIDYASNKSTFYRDLDTKIGEIRSSDPSGGRTERTPPGRG